MNPAKPTITKIDQVCIGTDNFDETVPRMAMLLGIEAFKCWDFVAPNLVATRIDGVPAAWCMRLGIARIGRMSIEVVQIWRGGQYGAARECINAVGIDHLRVETGASFRSNLKRFSDIGCPPRLQAKIVVPLQLGPVKTPRLSAFGLDLAYLQRPPDLPLTLEVSAPTTPSTHDMAVSLGHADYYLGADGRRYSQPKRIRSELAIGLSGVAVTVDRPGATQRFLQQELGLAAVTARFAWTADDGSRSGADHACTIARTAHAAVPGFSLDLVAASRAWPGSGSHRQAVVLSTAGAIDATVERCVDLGCRLLHRGSSVRGAEFAVVDAARSFRTDLIILQREASGHSHSKPR
jgi:hypothetical protein